MGGKKEGRSGRPLTDTWWHPSSSNNAQTSGTTPHNFGIPSRASLPSSKAKNRGFTLQRGKGRRSAPELLLCLLFRRRHSIRLQRCPTGTASAGGGPHDCRRRKMFLQREGGSGLVQFRILPSTPGPKRQRGTRSNCPFDLVLRRRRLWVTVGPEWRTDIWEEGK